MKDITKMSKEEIMEAKIKMPPTYRNLTKDEKNIQNYRNKLDDIILEVCEKEYKITGMKGYLWYQKDYNMCQTVCGETPKFLKYVPKQYQVLYS